MTDLAEGIESNLNYYNYLEPVTKRLNAPGAGNFVRSREFSNMLSRLDECLEYMSAHVSRPFKTTYSSRSTYVSSHHIGRHLHIAQDIVCL